MRLLLTRPAEEGERTRLACEAAGHRVLVSPVLRFEALPVALDLTGMQALAVTSRQGLRSLAQATPRRDLPLFAVGAATAALARDAGFRQVLSAEGDRTDLARLLAGHLSPGGGPILHVTGTERRGDLGESPALQGFTIVRTELYQARALAELDRTAQGALTHGQLDAVAFFSPRSAAIFVTLVRRAGLARACAGLLAACLSPAVARSAGVLPWAATVTAATPSLPSLLAALAAYDKRTDR
jgi:uroporphyrinogen-III synthase